MEANQILQSNILDIIFDGKNKLYGAYDLRKTYNSRIATAMIATITAILFFIVGSAIADKFKKDQPLVKIETTDRTLQPKPDEQKIILPPRTMPSQQVASLKVNTPVITKDPLVTETPPDVKQMENAKIDSKTVEGNKFNGIVNPPSDIIGSNVIATVVNKKTSEDSTFRKVEIEAAFPGGSQAWQRYIQRAIASQLDEFTDADFGTCIVQFIVDKNGKVSNVIATTMQGTKLAQIAVTIISKGPNWTPAIQNGQYVNAYRTQPVTLLNPNQ